MAGIKEAKKKRQQEQHNIRGRKRKQRRRKRKIQRFLILLCMFIILLLLLWGIIAGIRGIISHFSRKSQPASSEATEAMQWSEIDTSDVVVKYFNLDEKASDSEDSDSEDSDSEDSDSGDSDSEESNKKEEEETDGEGDEAGSAVQITISSMGDCTLGTDENFDPDKSFNAFYNAEGPDYFFDNVRSVLEKDDLSIVNFEGTLTDASEREEKKYAFKGDPDYVSVLSESSVEAANVANNHSQDYGEQSYLDTLSSLEDAGVIPFGYEQAILLETQGVKVGLTGIYELKDHLEKSEQVRQNIAALKKTGADLIVVNFHWGKEREYTPDETQKKLAHLAIDAGADLVIGHHPHVLQGVERYKGKDIAYSLGNFCFGGNSNPEDQDTMIFQQTFTIQDGAVQDNAKRKIIPCRLSSTTEYNDYCPTPLGRDEGQEILDKIEEISEGL